jgi:hypothetical protein
VRSGIGLIEQLVRERSMELHRLAAGGKLPFPARQPREDADDVAVHNGRRFSEGDGGRWTAAVYGPMRGEPPTRRSAGAFPTGSLRLRQPVQVPRARE